MNPVSDQCEAAHVPCIGTIVPWQSWFLGRGGKIGTSADSSFVTGATLAVDGGMLL